MAMVSTGSAQAAETARLRGGTLPNGMPWGQYRLGNGLNLYLVENRSAPVFTYQTWFNVGSKDEKLDPRLSVTGLAHLFEHMMFRGTLNHADGEFDRILTRNGGHNENATTWFDRTNYYQDLPRDRLELIMGLESDRMANLAISRELLETEKSAVLGEYHMCQDEPDTIAYDRLYGTAFTTHPYRFTTIGTEAEISAFTKESAEYFYRKYYAPNNATLLVIGDIDPQATLALAEKHYGAYPAQTIVSAPVPQEPEQSQERRVEFTHSQLGQPKMIVGYHAPGARHADQPALLMAQSILTTGEGSVLQQAWVNAGLAVSIHGSVNQFKDPGLFVLAADLQSTKTPEQLLEVLEHELSELAANVSARELERARNQYLLDTYQVWQENHSLGAFMGEFISAAGDPMFAFELVSAVERVTPAEVQDVVKRYLIPNRRTVVVGQPK